MNITTASRTGFEASPLFGAFGFSRLRASWRAMMSGYRAYQVYSEMDAMSDVQLNAKSLDRSDLPAHAVKSIIDAD